MANGEARFIGDDGGMDRDKWRSFISRNVPEREGMSMQELNSGARLVTDLTNNLLTQGRSQGMFEEGYIGDPTSGRASSSASARKGWQKLGEDASRHGTDLGGSHAAQKEYEMDKPIVHDIESDDLTDAEEGRANEVLNSASYYKKAHPAFMINYLLQQPEGKANLN
jgi:hypothetical protein